MGIEVNPLSHACGAEILGLDLARRPSPDDVAAIEAALDRHKVLLVRKQPLSAHQLADFSASLGELLVHVQRSYLHPEVPEVVRMTNKKADGTFDEVGATRGVTPRTRDGWHTDLSFEAEPAKATLLHAVEVPDSGGNTCFSNTTMGYLDLPDATKRRLNGLRAEFVYGQARRNKLAAKAAENLDADAKARTTAVHPAIVRHASTGEPGIYVNAFTTARLLDLPENESETLIEMLIDRIEDQSYRWEHTWSVGDTLIWDNRGGLMHTGRMDYPRDQARRFLRTTVKGGRLQPYDWTG